MVFKFHHSVIALQSYFYFTRLKMEHAIVLTLMEKLGTDHIAIKWKLFNDNSKASLQAGLLHNGINEENI